MLTNSLFPEMVYMILYEASPCS